MIKLKNYYYNKKRENDWRKHVLILIQIRFQEFNLTRIFIINYTDISLIIFKKNKLKYINK